jgi:serine phosphatase RsbU (regulator of sigma subunit)
VVLATGNGGLRVDESVRGPRRPNTSGSLSPTLVVSVVVIVCALLSLSLSWAAWSLNRDNDHRLLEVQTRQAADVVSSTILAIANPLATALKIEVATGDTGPQFERFMSAYVGPGRLFISASLWEVHPQSIQSVATIGVIPDLLPGSVQAKKLAAVAAHSATFVVTDVRSGDRQRVGYAVAETTGSAFVIYAERAIPSNRRVAVEANSAFSDLDFATYLGATTSDANLATTDLPLSHLPLTGNVARVEIPFGNSSITLEATPRSQLGGTIGGELPWFILIGGALLTVVTSVVANQLARRRHVAERDSLTISELYDRLDALYGEQRTIAETLQRALLPQQNPPIDNLEIASRYVAGVAGVDVGGDWYSIIALDERHFGFVVGDVSGRGVGAATIMARLRFTIRAYLFEGHAPDVALEMCSRQLDVDTDGYIATVLVGLGDITTGEIELANAGHMAPLIVANARSSYVRTKVGPPLGIGRISYELVKIRLSPGATLLAFTDGLIERREEGIDAGFERLSAASERPGTDLEAWLDRVVSAMAHEDAEDDIAALAFKWTPAHDRLEEPTLQLD